MTFPRRRFLQSAWTPDRFNRFMDEDVKHWTPLVRKLGIAID